MSEVKDPKIKLFGKTIELPENSAASAAANEAGESGSGQSCEPAVGDSSNQDPACSSDSMLEDSKFLSGDAEEQEALKTPSSVPKLDHAKEENQAEPLTPKELKDSNTTQPTITDSNTLSDSDASMKTSKTEEDQTETTSNNSNEKTLKKPDKILPCPRCNSMDTKFCYFNNYNVNQHRHFCKNCQRYWTAGGTMRNVPVGAGRRRNKNSVPQFRHLTVPEALQPPNGIHHNPAVLTFGSDSPLCESIASVLNIPKNRPRKPEELRISVSHGIKENGDDRMDEVGGKTRSSEPMPICHLFSYLGPHWPYPWNPVQWGPGSFPVPFYSTALPPQWGWNVPWVIPPAAPSASGPNLRMFGKHSREDDNVGLKDISKEEEMVKESNPEKCLWAPKTLRIDDPGEAAKSSIWATLGIKNDGVDCGGGGGLFKAFRTERKGDVKAQVPETSTVLQANPAALSRSLSFYES